MFEGNSTVQYVAWSSTLHGSYIKCAATRRRPVVPEKKTTCDAAAAADIFRNAKYVSLREGTKK